MAIDEQLIVALERLRSDLDQFRIGLRKRHAHPHRPVTSQSLRSSIAKIAETWLTDLSQRPALTAFIPSKHLADLTVHFQRLLRFSEHSTQRQYYEREIRGILTDYSLNFVIPLKQLRGAQGANLEAARVIASASSVFQPTAFVGHSFEPADKSVADCVMVTLESLGIKVVTGQRPQANRISDKVKKLIDEQYLFVGIFTRREKIARSREWTTSAWVIDEKAYAVGKGRKLILLKEEGVQSIGGIQGDYEFIEFSQEHLDLLAPSLITLFDVKVHGLHA